MEETNLNEGLGPKAAISAEELTEVIKRRDPEDMRRITSEINDVDLAEAVEGLDPESLVRFFRDLHSVDAAPLFDCLNQETKERLIAAMTDKELAKIIERQAADDLADTVGDMPANLAVKVLKAATPETREDVNRLLKYRPDSAGAVMTTEYLEFKEDATVKEAMEEIRKRGKAAETVYTLFLRDQKRHFTGTVDLDDLIFSSPETVLSQIMNKDAPWVDVNTDREAMANAFRRYNVNAMAVLNSDGCLTGIVTIDDAVDVMTQESTEDVEHMAGVSSLEDSYLETHPFKMAKKCVPWIVLLLVLGTFSSMVLSSFQNALSLVPVLAAFIPTLMDTGGNAGGQTIALMIRGLALGEFKPKQTGKIIARESLSALIIAGSVALFAFIWFMIEMYLGIVSNGGASVWTGDCWTLEFFTTSASIAGVVALTMFVAILVSKVIAVLLPMGAAALKKDPAIVSQPLLTTIVDVTSLVLFFVITEMTILPVLG